MTSMLRCYPDSLWVCVSHYRSAQPSHDYFASSAAQKKATQSVQRYFHGADRERHLTHYAVIGECVARRTLPEQWELYDTMRG